MASELLSIAKALEARFKKLEEQHGALDKDLEKTSGELVKKPAPKLVFKGLTGAYMDAVKASDGLTSARPATVKAIQNAEKSPSAETIGKAADEMKKHLAELEKTSQKEKTFAKFQKQMADVVKKTEALAG